ncbi:MAG: BMP family ABC transporter substrate-binding protein [Treponema sp.]|nr:BMP family ABC transporter substrate-binding protein [Treponema sp.]
MKTIVRRGNPVWVLGLVLLLSACQDRDAWKPGMPLAKEKVKIAVIYPNRIDEDSGYDYAHHMGILQMRRELELEDGQIIQKLNVFEEDAGMTENAMKDAIREGAHIIIAPSWGYMDACEKLASQFPRTIFAHSMGYKYNESNFTNYFGRIYQARYLSGIAAGLKTQTRRIGYVAAMGKDNSEVSGGVNAFALGVERVNPEARIYVRITYNWYDPLEETLAADYLINLGCDVIAQHCNTAAPQEAAQRAGVWGIGYNTDMSRNAPGAVLTSVVLNWGVYYTRLARSVIDGTFTTAPYLGSLREGMVGITPLAPELAAPGTGERIAAERDRITGGSFDVFEGALETNDGRVIGEAGKRFPDRAILRDIHWYYRTVIETNPSP